MNSVSTRLPSVTFTDGSRAAYRGNHSVTLL